MGRYSTFAVLLVTGLLSPTELHADESNFTPDRIRDAIGNSIPLLEKGSRGSADQRQCFTCHNQALPVFALVEAKKRGFDVDEDNLKRQLQHTATHLERGRQRYLLGKGQGGKAVMAGYALWTLEAGSHTPDETTAAVTSFLLKYQSDMNHWRHRGNRPPSSGSDFTTTYVALRGLDAFGTKEQAAKIDVRKKSVREWLLKEAARDTEDRVFRLRSLIYADAPQQSIQAAVQELIDSQRSEGGWAQTADMKSDAYAAATVIVALVQAGGLTTEHFAVRRGLRYLLDTQQDDGSWHVTTRAKPFQTYYESGFPHEQDQFISISATAWATLALLQAQP